jgi:hypothetical protein
LEKSWTVVAGDTSRVNQNLNARRRVFGKSLW